MSKKIMTWALALSFVLGAAGISRIVKAADEAKPAATAKTDEAAPKTTTKHKHHKHHKKPASTEAAPAPAK